MNGSSMDRIKRDMQRSANSPEGLAHCFKFQLGCCFDAMRGIAMHACEAVELLENDGDPSEVLELNRKILDELKRARKRIGELHDGRHARK